MGDFTEIFALLAKYFSVAAGAAFKFVFGPLAGLSVGLSLVETALLTVAGAMFTVCAISLGGETARLWMKARFGKKKKLFSKNTRRSVALWRKYGVYGAAFLMPLILTPPGGTLLASAFGEKPSRTIFWMAISSFFWSFAFTSAFYWLGEEFVRDLLGR